MTLTATRAPETALRSDRPGGTGRTARREQPTPVGPSFDRRVALACFLVALALRLFEITRSMNVFIDEVIYSEIGRSVAVGHGVSAYGQPFNLHPPYVFVMLGGVIRAFSLQHVPIDTLILDLRPVMAVLGAGTVAGSYLLARRCGLSQGLALVPTALLAVDPFQISFDSRVMLEANAQVFTVVTVSLLVATARDYRPRHAWRASSAWPPLGGVSAGIVFCTKETFGLVLALTLVLVALWAPLRLRRAALTMLGVAMLVYATMTVVVWSTTGFEPWWDAHKSGFTRLIGTYQSTGFNSSTVHVTLVSRLLADARIFASSYVLLLVGVMSALFLVVRALRWRRSELVGEDVPRLVIAIWALSATCYLAYATLFGSLEEQMYYILLTPCVVAIAVAAPAVAQCLPARGRRAAALQRYGFGAFVLVLVLFGGTVWVQQHSRDNNSYALLSSWYRANEPSGLRVGVAEDTGQFLLPGVLTGPWVTVSELRSNQADLALVNSSLVEQGYSDMSPETLRYLQSHAVVLFTHRSDRDGTLYLFDVRDLAPA